MTPFYSFCAILQLLPASLFTISNMNESYENFKKSSRYVGYIPNAYFMELMNLSSKFTGLFFKARNLWSSLPDVCNLKIHEEFWMGIPLPDELSIGARNALVMGWVLQFGVYVLYSGSNLKQYFSNINLRQWFAVGFC